MASCVLPTPPSPVSATARPATPSYRGGRASARRPRAHTTAASRSGRLWVSSGSQGGPPRWPSPPLLPALLARGGDAVYQQLTGSRNVFTAVVVVPAVDMPPVEIRAITFITGVGQSDPIVMPGVAPRGHGNDDFHS
jgi:hypothetical protein